jgi:5-methylcytosine-specific restriction endonuclease McrA
MAKLKTLQPRLASLSSTIAYAPKDEQQYDRDRSKQHWRKWYNTKRWRQLRWTILTRDLFTCTRCHRAEGNTSLLVCDHERAHRGNEALFWDEGNLTTLCKPCHDGAKQRAERRGVV